MRFEALKQQVGRNLKKDVRHEEYDEGGVELVAFRIHMKVGLETEDGGIGDVDSVEESKKVEYR